MLSLDRFSTLVADIYEAAIDPSSWERALSGVASASGGTMGALLLYDPRERSQFISVNLDPEQKRSYDEYYGRLDPVASVLGRTTGRKIITVRETLTETQLRGEFFNDWAHPAGVGDGIFVDVSQHCDRRCIFGVAHPWRAEPFASPEVLRLVSLLAPHLQRAAQPRSSFGPLNEIRDGALDLVEHWRRGCVMIARSGDVLYANRAARLMAAAGDGLGIRRGLHAAAASENAALLRLIGRACKSEHGEPRSGGRIAISRPSGHRPYLVQILPIGPDRAAALVRAAAALAIIVDSEHGIRLSPADLCDLHGLTAAEAEVAIRVLQGNGLRFVAEDLRIGLSTVRAHLKRIFDKTGAHRQAELVRLLIELEAGGL